MTYSTTSGKPFFIRRDAAFYTAASCGVSAILLILLVLFSQIVLAINPYRDAAERVSTLLQTAPDLETRLDYASLTHSRLQDALDPTLAYGITTKIAPSAEEQLIAALAPSGVRATLGRTHTWAFNTGNVSAARPHPVPSPVIRRKSFVDSRRPAYDVTPS
jgi:hypothetical protein